MNKSSMQVLHQITNGFRMLNPFENSKSSITSYLHGDVEFGCAFLHTAVHYNGEL